MKKWFTLIEVLITTVMIGALTILLFQTYQSITSITVRIENEKQLNQNLLSFYQSLQNIADSATIDYDAYSGAGIDLLISQWWTSWLFLTYNNEKFSIINKGCISTWCDIVFEKNGENIQFFSSSLKFDRLFFKVMPYEKDVFGGSGSYDDIQAPGFVIYSTISIKKYSEAWPFRVKLDTQNFFNLPLIQ